MDAAMNYRRFGGTDMKVSEIGVGGGRLGATLKQGTSGDVTKMLLEAFDSGITFYDTADSYGQGKSEELIGSALKRNRDEVVIATKTGYRLSTAAGFAAKLKPVLRPFIRSLRPLRRVAANVRSSQTSQDFSAGFIRDAIEGSLRRLQTDRIDLYQLHSPPCNILRSGEVFSVLDELRSEGKIRYYGVACLTVEDAVISLQHPGVSSVQVAINLLEREAITRLLPSSKELNVAVIARQPFASGFLVQSQVEIESHAALVDQDLPERKARAAAEFRFLAKGPRSMAQAAIQFVLHQDGVSVVLPGMSSIEHLRENLCALTSPPLTDEEISMIDSMSERRDAAGRS
jgi:aryl-alcohol dehydrogenase-like predicted oxidoreductase